MKSTTILTAAVFSVAVAIIYTSCGTAHAETVEAEPKITVNTQTVKTGCLDDYLEFGGDVVPSNSVDVLPSIAGKVTNVLVATGDHVVTNQIIAEVDASKPGATYSASPVRASSSGTIISSLPSTGTYVNTSSVIAKISSTNNLELHMNVPERFISRVSKGQHASITFDSYARESFNATVVEVSPVLDNTTRTMKVTLRFTNADNRIKSGMYARIHLVTQAIDNVVVIPYSAVLTRNNKMYVFATTQSNSEKRVHAVDISTGLHVDDKIEITSGIEPGTEIVVKGQTLLSENELITALPVEE